MLTHKEENKKIPVLGFNYGIKSENRGVHHAILDKNFTNRSHSSMIWTTGEKDEGKSCAISNCARFKDSVRKCRKIEL